MLSSNAALLCMALLFSLLSSITATDLTELCKPSLVYSPFTPWFKGFPNLTSSPYGAPDTINNMACWWYADCISSFAPDTRKQQFAATSLVMGLVPLILKDIAWPKRRRAFVPHRQPLYIEVLVRGLGLDPVVAPWDTIPEGWEKKRRLQDRIGVALWALLLLTTYAALAIIELYSKRSSLGCPVPCFLVLWFIAGLGPAAVEVLVSWWSRRRKTPIRAAPLSPEVFSPRSENEESESDRARVRGEVIRPVHAAESIPGGQHLLVQLVWAVYYTLGTLFFTSIMLVTVAELAVFIATAGAVTAASKVLGHKLCLFWGVGFER